MDRPRKSLNDDKFGFKYLIGALVAMLRDMQLPGSFTIGVFGAWGSGKSTFMRMLESELAPRNDFVTLFFDAWAFEDEKQGRLFLPMLLELGRVSGDEAEKLAVSIARDLVEGMLAIAIQEISKGAISAKSVKGAIDAFFRHETEQPIIVNYITKIKELVRIVTRGYNRKLVVFIDDLDRCRPPQLAVELLEDLKLLMDLPNTVFVIGVDRGAMLDVIKTTYRLRQDEVELPSDFAQRFMEKFIQLPIHLPPHIEHELKMLSDKSNGSKSDKPPPVPPHRPQKPADINLAVRIAHKIGKSWALLAESLAERLRSFNRLGIKEMKIEHRISMAKREIEELLKKERFSPLNREMLNQIYGIISYFRTTLEYRETRQPSRHLEQLANSKFYGLTKEQREAFSELALKLKQIEQQLKPVIPDEEIELIMKIAQKIKSKVEKTSEYYYILENNPRRIIIFENSIDYLLYVFAARAVLGNNINLLSAIDINKVITSMLVRILLPEITDVLGFYKYVEVQKLVFSRERPNLEEIKQKALKVLQLSGSKESQSKESQLEKILTYLITMIVRKEKIWFEDFYDYVFYFFPNIEDVSQVIENAQEIAYILGIIYLEGGENATK